MLLATDQLIILDRGEAKAAKLTRVRSNCANGDLKKVVFSLMNFSGRGSNTINGRTVTTATPEFVGPRAAHCEDSDDRWSGRMGSNHRLHPGWDGALPLSYIRDECLVIRSHEQVVNPKPRPGCLL